MSTTLEVQKKMVKQLRIDASMERKKLSEVCNDLVAFCLANQTTDALVSGFTNEKENPYKDKNGCDLI